MGIKKGDMVEITSLPVCISSLEWYLGRTDTVEDIEGEEIILRGTAYIFSRNNLVKTSCSEQHNKKKNKTQ